MEVKQTGRNFPIAKFTDKYNHACSIQQSSIMDEPCIWLGIDDADPQIMTDKGWKKYPLNEKVLLSTRMHLNIDQVKELLPLLKKFVKTGEII